MNVLYELLICYRARIVLNTIDRQMCTGFLYVGHLESLTLLITCGKSCAKPIFESLSHLIDRRRRIALTSHHTGFFRVRKRNELNRGRQRKNYCCLTSTALMMTPTRIFYLLKLHRDIQNAVEWPLKANIYWVVQVEQIKMTNYRWTCLLNQIIF